MSHPTTTQLLEAVQLFLKEAGAALDGRLAFHARVAANTLAIVTRELAQDPDAAEAEALAPFGGVAAACRALRDGRLDPGDQALLRAVREAALARLGVDNPRYATYARLLERPVP
jgi:hypothetical protein